MRGRIVVSAIRLLPVDPLRPGPGLVGKRPIRWIDDHASGAGREEIPSVLFESVVGASGIRLVVTRQVRFPVRGAAKIRARLHRRQAPARRHLRRFSQRRRWRARIRIPGARIAFEGAVGFLRFRLTLVFEEPVHVLLPHQRHADLPGFREDLGILDGGFVLDGIGVEHRISLGHVQRIAVKIPGHVEPRLIVVVRDLHHQRVAFPAAARIPHPGVDPSCSGGFPLV